MKRIIVFGAGVAAGFAAAHGAAISNHGSVIPDAAAAPAAEVQQWRLKPAQPMKAPTPKLGRQRCASGFRATPSGSSYGCSNRAPVHCPGGGQPADIRLYRQGNDPAGTSMLIYTCPQRHRITPVCAKGFVPGRLQLYRSGNAPGIAQTLIYQCIRYRQGTDR